MLSKEKFRCDLYYKMQSYGIDEIEKKLYFTHEMNNNNKKKLIFSSYNCRSFGETKYDIVSELLSKSDFCLLQEHWMYPERFLEVV